MSESYEDPCPCCGARLLGFTREDYIDHLEANGETLAAKIEREMFVPAQSPEQAEGCAGANRGV